MCKQNKIDLVIAKFCRETVAFFAGRANQNVAATGKISWSPPSSAGPGILTELHNCQAFRNVICNITKLLYNIYDGDGGAQ